jgi:hypothetical protein
MTIWLHMPTMSLLIYFRNLGQARRLDLVLERLRAVGAEAIISTWWGLGNDHAFQPTTSVRLACPFLYISAHVAQPYFAFSSARNGVAYCTPYRCLYTISPYHDSMTNITIGRRDIGCLFGFSGAESSRPFQQLFIA